MEDTRLSFGDLPQEILILIADQTKSARAISSLSRTNRTLHTLLIPYLYRHNAKRKKGRSALVWAAMYGHEATARVALEHHNPLRKTKPLFVAVEYGHSHIVQLLIDSGADIEAIDKDNYTALEVAVMKRQASIVKQLLAAGANVQPRKTRGAMRQEMGSPLLFYAMRKGFSDVARAMIESGRMDLEQIDRVHVTALCLACWLGPEDVVEYLLAAGANPNTTTRDGTSAPLSCAIAWNNAQTTRLLLAYGADPNLPTNGYLLDINLPSLPLHAIRRGHADLARELLATDRLGRESMLEGLKEAITWNEWSTNALIPGLLHSFVGNGDVDTDQQLRSLLHQACSERNLMAVACLCLHVIKE
ncbi:ankyrin repeat-containing domain protein [Aspergillus cavernicola]|uniref:Ankyrin repeat-containing domain protein n=1 Tax=Aspergillus cavernicola TaxID=176166 RepID=A0ABR4IWN2_9EURO